MQNVKATTGNRSHQASKLLLLFFHCCFFIAESTLIQLARLVFCCKSAPCCFCFTQARSVTGSRFFFSPWGSLTQWGNWQRPAKALRQIHKSVWRHRLCLARSRRRADAFSALPVGVQSCLGGAAEQLPGLLQLVENVATAADLAPEAPGQSRSWPG